MKESSYKSRDRCFSCNTSAWLTASLDEQAVIQNKHNHHCSSYRQSVVTRVLTHLCYLAGDNVLSTHSLVIWCFCSLSPEESHLSLQKKKKMLRSISNAIKFGDLCINDSLASFHVAQNRSKSKRCLNCQWEPDFALLSMLLTSVKLNQRWQWWEMMKKVPWWLKSLGIALAPGRAAACAVCSPPAPCSLLIVNGWKNQGQTFCKCYMWGLI